jgi:hypothetical protein
MRSAGEAKGCKKARNQMEFEKRYRLPLGIESCSHDVHPKV